MNILGALLYNENEPPVAITEDFGDRWRTENGEFVKKAGWRTRWFDNTQYPARFRNVPMFERYSSDQTLIL